MAKKYLEDTHIIAPAFRKHLFRYTWIVFMFHSGLAILFYFLKSKLIMFPPLFSVPRMDSFFSFLNQIPMIWVYDFGLVALFLFFITRSKKKVDLPWPLFKVRKQKKVRTETYYTPPRPHLVPLLLMTVLFSGLLYFFLQHGTIFFKSFDFNPIEPLFSQPASVIYSLAVIFWVGLEIIFFTMRFLTNTYTLELIKNLVFLLTLWGFMNISIGGEVLDIPWLKLPVSLEELKTGIIVLITLIIFLETLGIVYRMVRNRQKLSETLAKKRI